MKKRVIMARKSRLGENDQEFDVEFWKSVGPQGIFAAMWQMVEDNALLKGQRGGQSRLQRTIECLKYRKG